MPDDVGQLLLVRSLPGSGRPAAQLPQELCSLVGMPVQVGLQVVKQVLASRNGETPLQDLIREALKELAK